MNLFQQGPPKTVVVSLKNAHFGPPPSSPFFKLCVKQPTFSPSSPFFSVESAHKVTGGGGLFSSFSSPPSFHSSHVAVCSHGNMGGGEETGWRKKEFWNRWKTWSRHDSCIFLKLATLFFQKMFGHFQRKDFFNVALKGPLDFSACVAKWWKLYSMTTNYPCHPVLHENTSLSACLPPSSTSVSARGDSLFFSPSPPSATATVLVLPFKKCRPAACVPIVPLLPVRIA